MNLHLTITQDVPPLISHEGISYMVEPRPNQSGSRNGSGEDLSRLWEIAPEVADVPKVANAPKAPSSKLGSNGHVSPSGAMDTCHPDIHWAHK
jgi:hypothetical protein